MTNTRVTFSGPDKLQISVVSFSSSVHNAFYLNTYHDKADLLTAMKYVRYYAGTISNNCFHVHVQVISSYMLTYYHVNP